MDIDQRARDEVRQLREAARAVSDTDAAWARLLAGADTADADPRTTRRWWVLAAAASVVALGAAVWWPTGGDGPVVQTPSVAVASTVPTPPTVRSTLPPVTPSPTPPPTDVTAEAVPDTTSPTPSPTAALGPSVAVTSVPSTVERGPVADCTADAIARDTGIAVGKVIFCEAGWALIIEPGCGDGEGECEDAVAFHVSTTGWVDAGHVYPLCADYLPAAGMTIYTAYAAAPHVCDPSSGIDPTAPRPELHLGDAGTDVRALQISLVAHGYALDIDATFGPSTEAAVRHYQQDHDLSPDGRAGPATRTALGM